MKITTVGLVALAFGCGSDDPKASPDAPIDTQAPPMTKTVSGTGMTSHVTDTGVVVTPRDFTTELAISSLSPDGADFDRNDAVGTATGTFTVPVDADDQSWDLELRPLPTGTPQFYVSGELAPDLGNVIGGRGDAVFATASTLITLNVTGLATWQDTDALEMLVSNTASMTFDVETELDTAPAAGDTRSPARASIGRSSWAR